MPVKNSKAVLDEVPVLVAEGLITPEQGERIARRYSAGRPARPNTALVVFGILGSILLANGIILILAHNWADLPQAVRTVIAFLPLVAGQATGLWVLVRRRGSRPWGEGVAGFIFLSVGAAVALVSQIYHVKGDVGSYLITWLLPALPLVYIFMSTTASVLYICGITAWAVADRVSGGTATFFWALVLPVFPYYWLCVRRNMSGVSANVVGWFIGICVACGGTLAAGSISGGAWVLVMIGLFVVLFALGRILFPNNNSLWTAPLYRIGIMGLIATYAVLSYKGVWQYLSFETRHEAAFSSYAGSTAIWIAAVGLSAVAARKNLLETLLVGAGLPLCALCFGLHDRESMPAILFSLYEFAIGLVFLVRGLRSKSGASLNFGFLVITVVVLLKFFDGDWSFTARGIAFSVLGAAFLAANIFLSRKKGPRT
jgi:uncharacterized membrane protein